jgi:hypothetical protein
MPKKVSKAVDQLIEAVQRCEQEEGYIPTLGLLALMTNIVNQNLAETKAEWEKNND